MIVERNCPTCFDRHPLTCARIVILRLKKSTLHRELFQCVDLLVCPVSWFSWQHNRRPASNGSTSFVDSSSPLARLSRYPVFHLEDMPVVQDLLLHLQFISSHHHNASVIHIRLLALLCILSILVHNSLFISSSFVLFHPPTISYRFLSLVFIFCPSPKFNKNSFCHRLFPFIHPVSFSFRLFFFMSAPQGTYTCFSFIFFPGSKVENI